MLSAAPENNQGFQGLSSGFDTNPQIPVLDYGILLSREIKNKNTQVGAVR